MENHGLLLCLLLNAWVEFPDILCLDSLMHHLPYFILGDILGKGDLSRVDTCLQKHRLVSAALCTLIFLSANHLLSGNPLSAPAYFLSFLRAVAFSALLYLLCSIRIPLSLPPFPFFQSILLDASRYSLQLYLFNGYLMTALRILICSILQIRTPAIIVLSIWLGNIAITLFLCKVILPKSHFLRTVCGL